MHVYLMKITTVQQINSYVQFFFLSVNIPTIRYITLYYQLKLMFR